MESRLGYSPGFTMQFFQIEPVTPLEFVIGSRLQLINTLPSEEECDTYSLFIYIDTWNVVNASKL